MAFDNLKSSESVLMEDILTENVFDSKLGSQNDSTDLFDCLVPEKNGDNESVEKDELRTDESCCTDEKDDVPIVSASLESSDVISSLVEGTGVQSVDDTSEINDSAENHSAPSVKTEYTLNSDEIKTNDDKDFVPTIVDIFGAGSEPMKQSSVDVSCNDTETESKNELPRVSIDDVQGSFKDLNANNHEKEKCEDSVVDNSPVIPVHTIDDDSQDISKTKETNDDTKSDTLLNDNVVIKQEPQDEEIDNDCMLVDADDVGTCFTSEIEIKEERPNSCENEDSEVFCIETTSQIPQPIPIKIEANFETDKEISSPKSASESTCSSTKTRTKSDADSTDERAKPSVAKSFTVVGYKCHLCDTSFKEHELLNEHMRLHRNNSLAERYRRTYGKQRKPSKYVCRSCGKRLSTGQSLAQHTMIHNNEKPHICPICKKDFRHLSNFKMHVQKHKEEEELRRKERDRQRLQARIVTTTADRSVARSADFGRLVGPLFVKETLLSKTPVATPKVERKAFDLKFPRARDNAKENMVFYQKANASYDESYTRARKFQDDIGDDVIPLKTFNNVDNIVMNATKFIVKVDNLDPNVLKRKIKTPDISIDKSALENKPPNRKRRVMLSPADGAKRVKLDQIENIIMDASTEGADDATVDYSYADDYDYDDDDDERCDAPKQEMLTDNELFELLNDDESSRPESNLVQGVASASPTKSNVIVLKNAVKTSPSDASHKSEAHASSFSQYMAEKSKEKIDSDKLSELTAVSERSCGEDDEPDKCDIYDRAFHNVALRRLTLIRRKAAENGGKVEDKYLLGPLFWRKAVQKAQNNQLQTEPTMSLNEAKLAYKRLNAFKFGKLDTRRTNDPAKLQQRAELKLQFVLDRVKAMTDLSHVNLAGPLYWKRTLKLAGIHSPADLKRLSVQSDPSIGDVQFVKSDEIVPKGEVNGCDAVTVNERVLDEAVILDGAHVAKPASHSVAVQASDFLENVVGNRLTTSCEADHTMVDSMLNDDLLKPTKLEYSAANAGVTDVPNVGAKDTRTETKAESILYDSLTKPKSSKHEAVSANEPTKSRVPVKSKSSISVPVKPTPSSTLRNRISTPSSSSARSHSTRQPAATAVVPEQAKVCDTNAIERYKVDVSKAIPVTTNVPIDAEVAEAAIDGGNIILNVDSADFQLIADSKGENGEETNYVLVSDGSGGVQLIKENDLQLVEDEATNTQYVVNMQGENFANFNINGEQLTYAIQLDGENYTTLQFVPDGVPLEGATKERIIGGEKTVTIDGTNYVIADAGADLNHIGKELSDFLHIDYGSLLKSENEDQQA